ncbi:hypothetical protein [Niabella hibiscisoli]|uniref:hypothetical protein n=1 Tax=Niabella hibiscisoli TaxID=1825928 RepID=UPI001F116229|nr:hypothetical protein [Niabella hibiscisoli]MCH5717622.1 hypothetical protein [Niabella hibiscisoli]
MCKFLPGFNKSGLLQWLVFLLGSYFLKLLSELFQAAELFPAGGVDVKPELPAGALGVTIGVDGDCCGNTTGSSAIINFAAVVQLAVFWLFPLKVSVVFA